MVMLLDFADGYLEGLDEIQAQFDDSMVKLPVLQSEFKRINMSVLEIGEAASQDAIRALVQNGEFAVLNKL